MRPDLDDQNDKVAMPMNILADDRRNTKNSTGPKEFRKTLRAFHDWAGNNELHNPAKPQSD
jgi:hypothetical protein